jgi:hypothetical protein
MGGGLPKREAPMFPTRRDLLLAAAATTATAGLVWSDRRRPAQAQEAPPETTKVTFGRSLSLCAAPLYQASLIKTGGPIRAFRWT